MLKTSKNVTVNGMSMIDGVQAAGYTASIDTQDPNSMNISSWQTDKALYKAHRAECRADAAEFEDLAYAMQDEMLDELEATKEAE